MRRRLRFSGQLLLLQLAVVTVVVLMGLSLFGWQLARQRTVEYGQRALAVARTVALDPILRAEVTRWSDRDDAGPTTAADLVDGPVQQQADQVRVRTGALFVVITDDRGIRLAHPDPDELGRPVSTDPSTPLAGGEEVVEQTGTLGESARAKVPILEPGTGRVVGAVSVGISTEVIDREWRADLILASAFAAGALCLGAACAVLLTRRLRRLTLGLEPEEMAALVAEHEAVLGGIADAVVATDTAGRITVANSEAGRLLGAAVRPDALLTEVGLPAELTDRVAVLATTDPGGTGAVDGPHHLLVGDRILIWSARSVQRAHRRIGVVLSFRDRTAMESLTRELDATRTVSSALRAQRHEFANRLHVVHGLVSAGRGTEATDYLEQVLQSGPLGEVLSDLDTIADPTLQAFLSAKAALFRERSVALRLGAETWLPHAVPDPVPLTVVLGNLLDNAADAAVLAADAGRAAWVEVELTTADDRLHLTVSDSGLGISEALRDKVFSAGISASGDPERGLGLALVRQVGLALGGEVHLLDPGGRAHGAIFHVSLPMTRSREDS